MSEGKKDHFSEEIYELNLNRALSEKRLNPPEDFMVSIMLTDHKGVTTLLSTYEPVYYGSRTVLPIPSGFKDYTSNKNMLIKVKAYSDYKISAIVSQSYTFDNWKVAPIALTDPERVKKIKKSSNPQVG